MGKIKTNTGASCVCGFTKKQKKYFQHEGARSNFKNAI